VVTDGGWFGAHQLSDAFPAQPEPVHQHPSGQGMPRGISAKTPGPPGTLRSTFLFLKTGSCAW
jgi:hypothetical protein